jgi:hypothetical protein
MQMQNVSKPNPTARQRQLHEQQFYSLEIQATKPEHRYNMDEAGITVDLGGSFIAVRLAWHVPAFAPG